MKPISTFGQTALRNSQLRRMESELATASQEIATQKKSDIAKSIGAQLFGLQSIRNQFQENEAYLRSIDLFKQRMNMIDAGLGETELAVNDLVEIAAINGADALDSASSVQLVAESAIDRIITSLNVQIGGRFLLGGAQVDINPLQPLDRANVGGVSPRDVAQQVTDGTAPFTSGTDLRAPLNLAETTELLDRFDDVFQGVNGASGVPGQEEYSFEQTIFNGEINGNLIEIRLPNNTVETQLNDELIQGLRDVLQGAYILSSVDLENIDDDQAYQELMTGATSGRDGALDLIAKGMSAVQRARADLGLRYQLVDAAEEATLSQNALFNNEIVRLENADVFETQSRFLNIEKQLEAAYSATGRVLNLTLWNFVR